MSDLKAEYDQYSTEYLLQRRSLGRNISTEIQQVIEELLRDRRVAIPPMPTEDAEESAVPSKPLGLVWISIISWIGCWIVFKILGVVLPEIFGMAGTRAILFVFAWAAIIILVWRYVKLKKSTLQRRNTQ